MSEQVFVSPKAAFEKILELISDFHSITSIENELMEKLKSITKEFNISDVSDLKIVFQQIYKSDPQLLLASITVLAKILPDTREFSEIQQILCDIFQDILQSKNLRDLIYGSDPQLSVHVMSNLAQLLHYSNESELFEIASSLINIFLAEEFQNLFYAAPDPYISQAAIRIFFNLPAYTKNFSAFENTFGNIFHSRLLNILSFKKFHNLIYDAPDPQISQAVILALFSLFSYANKSHEIEGYLRNIFLTKEFQNLLCTPLYSQDSKIAVPVLPNLISYKYRASDLAKTLIHNILQSTEFLNLLCAAPDPIISINICCALGNLLLNINTFPEIAQDLGNIFLSEEFKNFLYAAPNHQIPLAAFKMFSSTSFITATNTFPQFAEVLCNMLLSEEFKNSFCAASNPKISNAAISFSSDLFIHRSTRNTKEILSSQICNPKFMQSFFSAYDNYEIPFPAFFRFLNIMSFDEDIVPFLCSDEFLNAMNVIITKLQKDSTETTVDKEALYNAVNSFNTTIQQIPRKTILLKKPITTLSLSTRIAKLKSNTEHLLNRIKRKIDRDKAKEQVNKKQYGPSL